VLELATGIPVTCPGSVDAVSVIMMMGGESHSII
jgi:hypothetical protein